MEDPVLLAILVAGIAGAPVPDLEHHQHRPPVRAAGDLHPGPGDNGAAGPGLVLLIPIIQQPVQVDLREFYIEVPQQTCITKDNAPISIDFLVYSKVFDPEQSVTAVTSFQGA